MNFITDEFLNAEAETQEETLQSLKPGDWSEFYTTLSFSQLIYLFSLLKSDDVRKLILDNIPTEKFAGMLAEPEDALGEQSDYMVRSTPAYNIARLLAKFEFPPAKQWFLFEKLGCDKLNAKLVDATCVMLILMALKSHVLTRYFFLKLNIDSEFFEKLSHFDFSNILDLMTSAHEIKWFLSKFSEKKLSELSSLSSNANLINLLAGVIAPQVYLSELSAHDIVSDEPGVVNAGAGAPPAIGSDMKHPGASSAGGGAGAPFEMLSTDVRLSDVLLVLRRETKANNPRELAAALEAVLDHDEFNVKHLVQCSLVSQAVNCLLADEELEIYIQNILSRLHDKTQALPSCAPSASPAFFGPILEPQPQELQFAALSKLLELNKGRFDTGLDDDFSSKTELADTDWTPAALIKLH